MSVDLYPEFFNDVFGPVMQPGSSSHTAGPCRLGNLARSLLGAAPVRVVVHLDPTGSFAGTFGVMAEDRAMLAGVMGMLPDDRRLFDADRLAVEAGIEYRFEFAPISESGHPNAVKFTLTSAQGQEASLVGASIGGGMVETRMIDGYPLRVKGDSYVLVVEDASAMLPRAALEGIGARLSGVVEAGEAAAAATEGRLYYWRVAELPDLEGIAAEIAAAATAAGAQPAAGTADVRPEAGATSGADQAAAGEPDARAEAGAVRAPTPPRVRMLAPVLPVMTRPGRRPQLFTTMTGWREIAAERGIPFWEVAVQYEMDASGWSQERILEQMRTLAAIMDRQTSAAYDEAVTVPVGPFKPDFAACWAVHAAFPRRLTDDLTAAVLTRAYGAGAGIPGVESVPGPRTEPTDVADAVGRGLPADLLCTSRGGAAAAPTALQSAAAYRAWVEETTRSGETRPPGNLI